MSKTAECESALETMRNEFGNWEVNVSFGSFKNQVDRSKRIAKDCDTKEMSNEDKTI